MDIKKYLIDNEEELIALRRYFHRIPETGYEEYKTSEKIKNFLEELGLEVETYTKTGVVSLLNKNVDGPTFLLRSDIDALDIKEETQLSFKSEYNGKMHACGHDAHIASLLMAAKILTLNKDTINGKILFVFQPNEERAGALNMINEGLLKKYPVDACAAIHMWPEIESGKFGITEGAVMAGMNHFHIIIEGIGGHTGTPHLAKDPIICAANIIQSLQTIQTREIDSQKPTIIMFGKLTSGTLSNIIPDKAELFGTVRYLYKMTETEMITKRIERYVTLICEAYGLKGHVVWEESHPSVYNDKEMVNYAKKASIDILGNSNNIIDFRSTTGEDFSEFTSRIPGVFCHIGTGNPDKNSCYPLHNPKFNIDESTLKLATELHVRLSTNWINQHSQ